MKVVAIAAATTVVAGVACFLFLPSKIGTGGASASGAALDAPATPSPAEPRSRPADSKELVALQLQVARLGAELESLRARTAASSAPPDKPLDPTDPENEAALRAERQAHVADIEAQFADEPRDRNWSSATHDKIVEALTANELRDPAASIECRSQTCRIEIVDGGPATNTRLIRAVNQLGQTLPIVEWDHRDDGNGHRAKVLYMSRHGG